MFAVAAIWVARADFSDIEYWKGLGYPGVFFITMLGSASVVIPVPAILAVCGAGGFQLNLFAVAALSGVGEAIGELSGYGVGYGGQGVVEKQKFYERSRRWMERRRTLALFVASVIPNPFFDVVGIAAGATRFPLTKVLLTVGIGKAIKALVVAYTLLVGVASAPLGDRLALAVAFAVSLW